MFQLHIRQWRGAATVLVAALLFVAPMTANADEAGLKTQVEGLLAGFDDVASPAEWSALGNDAAPVLREIAANTSLRLSERSRAVSALSYFNDVETQAFLKGLLASPSAQMNLQRKALVALALSSGDVSLETLEPFTNHENYRMRESAVRAMALVATPKAQAVLRARLSVETSEAMRATIKESISKMEVKP